MYVGLTEAADAGRVASYPAFNSQFLESGPNCKTQSLWVKGIQIVPNRGIYLHLDFEILSLNNRV